MPQRLFSPRYAMLLIGLVLAAILAALVASQVASGEVEDDSADAGFLRDMSVHHDQAVEMALIIRDRTEDPLMLALATDIMLTQQSQVGMMGGWLQVWDLPQTGEEPAMTWMGHSTEGRMPGMASAEEIRALRELPVAEAEVSFLRVMIVHHQAGVEMARACLERCDEDLVRGLAENIVQNQQYEIEVMNDMLADRGQGPESGSGPGATPEATPAHEDHG